MKKATISLPPAAAAAAASIATARAEERSRGAEAWLWSRQLVAKEAALEEHRCATAGEAAFRRGSGA